MEIFKKPIFIIAGKKFLLTRQDEELLVEGVGEKGGGKKNSFFQFFSPRFSNQHLINFSFFFNAYYLLF